MATVVTRRGSIDTPVVVDTDVISLLFKRDSRAASYEELLRGLPLVVSFMSYAELHQWARFRSWGTRKIAELEDFLGDYTLIMSTEALCEKWADVRAECRAAGAPISAQDAWQAALSLHFGIPLATHNVRDFRALSDLTILTSVGSG